MYTRRKEPVELLVPRPLSLSAYTPESPSSSTTDLDYPSDIIFLSTPPTPLLVRQTTYSNAGVPPDRYGSTLIIILLIMSLTLTYHVIMEHSLHIWILYLLLSVSRMLRKIISGKRSC
jgi:hypothetical protein